MPFIQSPSARARIALFFAIVPFPLAMGLMTLVFMQITNLVLTFIDWLAQPPGLASLTFLRLLDFQQSFILDLCFAFVMLSAVSLIAGIGRLTGYRPCVQGWPCPDQSDPHQLFSTFTTAAKAQGFTILSSRPPNKLIAVNNIDLIFSLRNFSGTHFPARLVIRFDPPGKPHPHVTIHVSGIGVCYRDTGETQTCRQIAQAILDQATSPHPHIPISTSLSLNQDRPPSPPPLVSPQEENPHPNITPVQFKPSRVEGLPDVSLVTIWPDRIQFISQNRSIVLKFIDMARFPLPAFLIKPLLALGIRPNHLHIADRSWHHAPRDRYFLFYTNPQLKLFMPENETDDMQTSHFARTKEMIHSAGFTTSDLG